MPDDRDVLKERIRRFSAVMTELGGNATRVTSAVEAAGAIEAILRAHEAPRVLLYERGEVGDALGLPLALRARGIRLTSVEEAGREAADLRVGVTDARAAIADSGTVLVGGVPGGWTLASALPWVHVVVLRAVDIAATLSTLYGRFGEVFAAGDRDWVWITGPSRTADIAKTLVTGVHGPNSLEVLIVDTSTIPVSNGWGTT